MAHDENASASDAEDYMSDMYTAIDIRPGIVTTHTQTRRLKIESKQVENMERLRNRPKISEMEKKMRDDGLAKPVEADSKGFLLLSKMGYKPGMSLGVEKEGRSEGIKEPIALELKSNRSGLGHDTEEDERRKKRMRIYQAAVSARAKAHEALIDDFSERKRWAVHLKQLSTDLQKSRKVCQELDARLSEITDYLRSTHCYCIWCGAQYDSEEELENSCPGKTRISHAGVDEDN
ncbi:unnamed protein product [Gongylonema pulchrum]|uniref:G patch domain-containing protein 11 n=1 Tax=Gongylonema pulchrum TaxID=637853 RepID=A0A183DRX5_9BILA|nr:unnamed protein product [Gongylonema pulchrum]